MKTKYAVISGFLGAGKTTAMIAFAQNINARAVGTDPHDHAGAGEA